MVTGATGYIGTQLCHALHSAGHTVAALVRKGSVTTRLPAVSFYNTAGAAVTDFQPDCVFHLASHVSASAAPQDLPTIYEGNLALAQQLLAALAASSCRKLVLAGTYWCFDEKGEVAPNTFYAACKEAAFGLSAWYARAYQMQITELVLHDVYGPADWRQKLLPSLARSIASGIPMDMTAAEQLLAFVHVDDVVEAFLQAERQLPLAGTLTQRFAVRGAAILSLRAVTEKMAALANRPLPVHFGARPYPPHQCMRPWFGQPLLPGWQPRIPLEQGLQQLIDEAENHV